MRIMIRIAFYGKNYYGTQRQVDKPTIQNAFEKALSRCYQSPVKVTICSRLDKDVNAYDFALTFDAINDNMSLEHLHYYLNRTLGKDIFIRKLQYVDETFSPRYDCDFKSYVYTIQNGKEINPLLNTIVYSPTAPLDITKITEAMDLFKGQHDFRAFSTPEGDENTILSIADTQVFQKGDLLFIRVISKSFLRYQVRFMVGAAIRHALDKLSLETISGLLEGQNLKYLKLKAEPQGLTLEEIHYLAIDGESNYPTGLPKHFTY
ncbi:MAG: tRNA pseudouridine(38-40) synthase TruA [Bacilli bacterium]